MSLQTCPECGKDVSSEAPACPHCGYSYRAVQQPQPIPQKPGFFDLKRNLRGLAIAATVLVCVIVGFFVFRSCSDEETQKTMDAVWRQTGGKVVPWEDRAVSALSDMPEVAKESWGKYVIATTHPTGTFKKVVSTGAARDGDQVVYTMSINWEGGFIGNLYTLKYEWRFTKTSHVSWKIICDDSSFAADENAIKTINESFSGQIYSDVSKVTQGEGTWK